MLFLHFSLPFNFRTPSINSTKKIPFRHRNISSQSDLLHKYFVKVFFKPINRITAGHQNTQSMEINISLTYIVDQWANLRFGLWTSSFPFDISTLSHYVVQGTDPLQQNNQVKMLFSHNACITNFIHF